jgi:pimeloyl-ACP methyl ester carboxylesterase
MIEPKGETLRANGLLHRVWTWEPASPREGTILFAHGFLDVGRSFHWTASRLAEEGNRVVAFDWRGHGESQWLPEGAYYHFFDYVADLADLVRQRGSRPLTLVGHSMGGTASVLFAGSHPDQVDRLVLIEGLGPEAPEGLPGPEHVRRWVDSVRAARERGLRPMASVEEAAEKLLARNPGLTPEVARDLAAWSLRKVEGGFVWSFDPVHRTKGPYPFRPEVFSEFLRALRMPVLCIEGERGYRTRDHEARVAALQTARRLEIPGAGHMLHWEAPAALAEAISRFASE